MKILLSIILFTWQLPQHLLGLLFILYWKIVGVAVAEKYKSSTVFIVSKRGKQSKFSGVSLGSMIFISYFRKDNPFIRGHEYGHSIQSRLLGPLYLILVGLPSVSMAIYSSIWLNSLIKKGHDFHESLLKVNRWYYTTLQEAWADKLGEVERYKI